MAEFTRLEYYERRKNALRNERQSFIAHYQELSQFIQPRKGRFLLTDRNRGDIRHDSIINSTATQAHRIARSGLLAGVMSPARPWFALATPDPDLMEFEPVKVWLKKVELILRSIFNQSNLYNMAPVLLGELLQFGTAAMSHVDDFDDVARFYTHTAGSYLIAQNDKYQVRTLMREYQCSVEQLIAQFGIANVSESVRNSYDRGNYDAWVDVVHVIEPNPDMERGSKLASRKPFRSVYYEPGAPGKDKFLSEGGFDEFPAYCPRWDVTGEDIYGTDCPAMTALGDIKGLQIEERRKAQAIDKMVNPPLKGPSTLKTINVANLPGGLTLYDQTGERDGLSPIYTIQPQLNELMLDIQKVEQRIQQSFYVDMFLAISNMDGIQPKNELELAQRNEERLLQIGPVLERLHGEFLNPLIDRTFNQCVRADILPPAPEELQGSPLKVEYISTLAMAQRAVATGGIERLSAYVGGLMGAGFVDAGDKFNADQSIDEYANVIGVPPKIVVPDEVVNQRRKERQEQQQRMMALEAAQSAANTAKMMSDAKTGDASVLTGMQNVANRR